MLTILTRGQGGPSIFGAMKTSVFLNKRTFKVYASSFDGVLGRPAECVTPVPGLFLCRS